MAPNADSDCGPDSDSDSEGRPTELTGRCLVPQNSIAGLGSFPRLIRNCRSLSIRAPSHRCGHREQL